ncbi:MAG TPA: hypothetical protein VMS71_04765 [Candidatus Acidoferrum sp.]|nr:hypothetical protein [Candidatus Acidoferrum sp.]
MLKIRIAILSCVMTASAFGQAKVGSAGARSLAISPSVEAFGMGGVSVMRWSGNWSSYFNPATLAFADFQYFSLSAFPGGMDLIDGDPGLAQRSLAVSVNWKSFLNLPPKYTGGVSYIRNAFATGPIEETSYEQGTEDGSGTAFRANSAAHTLSLALGYSSNVKFGLGISYTHYTEDYSDYGSYGNMLNFGVIGKMPILLGGSASDSGSGRLRADLSLGAEIGNIGPQMKFLEKAYPLPHAARFGAGFDLRYKWLTVFPAFEWEDQYANNQSYMHSGAEVGLFEFAALRIGYISAPTVTGDVTTYGLSLSSLPVTRHLVGVKPANDEGFFIYLLRNMNLKFSYAHGESDGGYYQDGADYYALEISL